MSELRSRSCSMRESGGDSFSQVCDCLLPSSAFHETNVTRRPRLSEPSNLQEPSSIMRSGVASTEQIPKAANTNDVPGFRHETPMPSSERPDTSSGVWNEMTFSERKELNQEQIVLRELRGSDSAVGITKKVCVVYKGSRTTISNVCQIGLSLGDFANQSSS